MENGKYYVIANGNNVFESMTKEQIVAAIAQATGETPTDVDSAFITKLKEQNRNRNLKVWVGTQAEYNAIATPDTDTLYIITDESDIEDLAAELEQEIDGLDTRLSNLTLQVGRNYVKEFGTHTDSNNKVWRYKWWSDGTVEFWTDRWITVTPTTVAIVGDIRGFNGQIAIPQAFFDYISTATIDGGFNGYGQFCVIHPTFKTWNDFFGIGFSGVTAKDTMSTSTELTKGVYIRGYKAVS